MQQKSWNPHGQGSPWMLLQMELAHIISLNSKAGPPRNEEHGFAHSLKQVRECRLCSSLSMGFHTTMSVGQFMPCFWHHWWIKIRPERKFSNPQHAMGGKISCLQHRGAFWTGAGYRAPLLCQSLLIHLWVQFLGKERPSGRPCSNWHGRIPAVLL